MHISKLPAPQGAPLKCCIDWHNSAIWIDRGAPDISCSWQERVKSAAFVEAGNALTAIEEDVDAERHCKQRLRQNSKLVENKNAQTALIGFGSPERISKRTLQSIVSTDFSAQETTDLVADWYGEQRAGDRRHRQAASSHRDQEENTHKADQRSHQGC